MDKLDFLDGQQPAAAAPAHTEPPVDQAPIDTGAADAPIAPVEGVVEAPVVVAPVVSPPPAAEPGLVPLSALLDEREQKQAERREKEALKAQLQAQTAPQADPYDDLPAYTQQVALNVKFDLSEDMAREKHGDPVVDAAREWALGKMQQSPAFAHEVTSHRNPYSFVVSQYQRDQMVSQMQPTDFEAFKAWQAAQAAITAGQTVQGAAPAPAITPTAVAAPPQSLASATSAGGMQAIPMGPGRAYDSAIK